MINNKHTKTCKHNDILFDFSPIGAVSPHIKQRCAGALRPPARQSSQSRRMESIPDSDGVSQQTPPAVNNHIDTRNIVCHGRTEEKRYIRHLVGSARPIQRDTVKYAGMEEMQEITAGGVVAIDGKTLRGSFDRSGDGKGAIHMVSAWLSKNRMVLGQLNVSIYRLCAQHLNGAG